MTTGLNDSQSAAIFADDTGLGLVPEAKAGTRWIGGYKLGSGSFGVASLWILIDESTRKPIKHLAIKDAISYESTHETGFYTGIYDQLVQKGLDFGVDPRRNIGDARPHKRFLKEAYLQGLMTEPESSNRIFSVPLWGYARKLPGALPSPNHHWRLYMPLYEYGDLHNIFTAHKSKNKAVPEPFLWHALKCLMTGALQLEEQARKRPNSTPSDVIVVCDMKPENTLLCKPDSNSFRAYPRLHIADLGGGLMTNKEDPKNLANTLSFGATLGYRAPEMISKNRDNEWDDIPLPADRLRGSCTNVWQIGRIIEQLMKLGEWDREIIWSRRAEFESMEPEVKNWKGKLPGQNYSSDLREVVYKCLRCDPNLRATPTEILKDIERLGPSHYEGMDTFGDDEWFEEQEEMFNISHGSLLAAAATKDKAETLTERKRRDERSSIYVRSWGQDKANRFYSYGVYPPEEHEIEYNDGKNSLWAMEDVEMQDANGNLLRPLPYFDKDGIPRLLGYVSTPEWDKAPADAGEWGAAVDAGEWGAPVWPKSSVQPLPESSDGYGREKP